MQIKTLPICIAQIWYSVIGSIMLQILVICLQIDISFFVVAKMLGLPHFIPGERFRVLRSVRIRVRVRVKGQWLGFVPVFIYEKLSEIVW